MTINIEKTIGNFKYFLLFIYILLVYIYGGNSYYTIAYKIPMFIFLALEGIKMVKRGKIEITNNIKVLYIFSFYLFVTSFWAIDSSYAVTTSKTVFLLTTFLLVSYNFIYYQKDSQNKLLNIIMYAGLLFSLYVIFYYGLYKYFNMLFQGIRIGEEIDNVNSIGFKTSITYMICLYFALNTNKKYYYLFCILPLIVSIGTGSRKVLVILLFGSLLLILFKSDKKNIKNILKKVLLVTLFLIILYYIVELFADASVFKRLEGLLNGIFGSGKADASTIERKKFIQYGMMQFKETPILGIGAGNSGYVTMKAAGWFTYLHNNYVELLATTGIIGFLLYYYNYYYLLKNIFKVKNLNRNLQKIRVLIISMLIILLILDYGMVSYYNKSIYIYFLIGLIFLKNRGELGVQKDN